MLKVVFLQMAALVLAALVAGFWVGGHGAVSVLIGGGAYLIPNLLFVLRLEFAVTRGRADAASFVVGELFKLTATIVMLALAPRWIDPHWPAMLCGLFVVLQANLFAFLLKTRS